MSNTAMCNRVLVLARTELIFAVNRRGHGQDPEVILQHLTSFSRNGGGGPFQVSMECMEGQLFLGSHGTALSICMRINCLS